jgi:multidrug resistance efflux pump
VVAGIKRWKVMGKKAFVVIIIGLLLLTAVLLWRNRQPQKPRVFRTTGVVEGREVDISPMIAGRIIRRCCAVGEAVHEGQVLVELESDELRAAVATATASVARARADIAVYASAVDGARVNIASVAADLLTAKAEVSKAQAELTQAQRDIARGSMLYQKLIIARADLDVLVTRHEAAVAEVDAARARQAAAEAKKASAAVQLETARRQLQAAKPNLQASEANADQARARLAQTVISSPMDGTVVYTAVETGETVSPGVTMMTLVDLAHLYVRADVEESVVGGIRRHQVVSIYTESTRAQPVTGTISEIGRYADFATQRDVSRGRQDIKTFKIKIDFQQTGNFFKPGMTVEVAIPLEENP